MKSRLSPAFATFAGLLLAGCATMSPPEDRLAQKDPLEKLNRGVWDVNQAADKVLIKPVTQVYRAVAPRPVRQGVSNAFANLAEPWSFINNVLQAQPGRAVRNFGRFLVNSTIGIAGLFDPASRIGIKPAVEDFGQTLGRWGINGGPYLVLPLLGPSTLRDGIGSGVAAYADPVRVAINDADVSVWYKRGYLGLYIIDARSQLVESGGDAFLESSLDPYATARSAYLQRRHSDIANLDEGAAATQGDTGLPDDSGTALPGDAPATGQSGATLPGDEAAAPAAPAGASGAALPGEEAGPPAQTSAPASPAPTPQ